MGNPSSWVAVPASYILIGGFGFEKLAEVSDLAGGDLRVEVVALPDSSNVEAERLEGMLDAVLDRPEAAAHGDLKLDSQLVPAAVGPVGCSLEAGSSMELGQ